MEQSIERRIYSSGKTFLCFIVFLIWILPLFLCYFVVSISRLLWRNFLMMKNQHLTFVKKDNLRTFSYTVRNPGIVNIILHLQGEPNVRAIRDCVNRTVLEKKTKSGELMFPKLSAKLVTCWGFYAWEMCPESFNIDNHINICPSSYRGRSVTESNIQDYISNIVSKYLPVGLPPWQICVIPLIKTAPLTRSEETAGPSSSAAESTSGNDTEEELQHQQHQHQPISNDQTTRSTVIEHYYVVVRMHHLLISEEPNLRLSDLLEIDSTSTASVLNARGELDQDRQMPKSPLADILQYPVYIPQLFSRLQIGLTNAWNEFKSKYDPYVGKPSSTSNTMSSSAAAGSSVPATSTSCFPHDDPKLPDNETIPIETLPQLFASLVISYITIANDFYKGFYATQHYPIIKMKFLNSLINREIKKRNVSWEVIWNSMCTTLNPIRIIKSSFEWVCWAGVTSILTPHLIFRELQAFRYCFFQGHVGYPDTLIGFMFAYIPLCYNALKECLLLIGTFVQAPRFIYEELIEIHRSDEHVLQNISLCGRKVLSWSKKISINDVRHACIRHGVSQTELYMSANSATLHELLHEFDGVPVPKQIRVFATLHNHDYLHGRLNNDVNYESGHLSLILPMEKVSRKQLKQIRQNFRTARENQIGIYFLFLLHKRFNVLTKFLPSMWTVIIFNYLSRRFSITITEITRNKNSLQQRTNVTCWGHNLLDVLFFSPLQSNGSISLSIQQFGDYIQLGVISDAQIHPLHMKLSEGWTRNLEKLF